MTEIEKNLSIAVMQGVLEEVRERARVSSLSEVDAALVAARAAFDANPENVSDYTIYRLYEMVRALNAPSMNNIHRYWQKLTSGMLVLTGFKLDGTVMFDGSVKLGDGL